MNLSEYLRKSRKKNKITQADVAKYIGISTRQYQKYEFGVNTPSLERLSKIAECFETTVSDMLNNVDNIKKTSTGKILVIRNPWMYRFPVLAEYLDKASDEQLNALNTLLCSKTPRD